MDGNRTIPTDQSQSRSAWQYLRPRPGPWLQLFKSDGFEWNTIEVGVRGLDPALERARLLHLSDLHLKRRWPGVLDQIISRVSRDPPEVILYGGDLVHDFYRIEPSLPLAKRLVQAMPSRRGAYAVLGNHDGDLLEPWLIEWGVPVLRNHRVEVEVNGATIELIGLAGPARDDLDEAFVDSLPPKSPGIPRIMLSHFPDIIRIACRANPDLYLSGHTHGGQICLPGGYPIIRHDSLPRRQCSGVCTYRNCCLVVNRGLGFSGFINARAFCPAEVLEIQLRACD